MQFDVVISGGGFVGMTVAIGLARKTAWKIALLEQSNVQARADSDFDARAIALIPSSIQLFQDLQIWPLLEEFTQPIERIHVSEQNRFGQVDLKAADFDWPYFGKVIEARVLGKVLLDVMTATPNVTVINPAQLKHFAVKKEGVDLEWSHQDLFQKATAKLLIAADGAQSFIRKSLGIECETEDFGQSALLANVLPDRPHQQSAYERFTKKGPLALLPITANRMTLIWCDSNEATAERAKLSELELLAEIQKAFGFRAGRFMQIGKRQVYPLNQFIAKEQWRDRVVLLGNTAHTLHPVAAQGLNLSLRDIAVLLAQFENAGDDPGARDLLQNYVEKRECDQKLVHKFTESLVFGFGMDNFLAGKLRSVGMSVFNILPGAKKLFARRIMGEG